MKNKLILILFTSFLSFLNLESAMAEPLGERKNSGTVFDSSTHSLDDAVKVFEEKRKALEAQGKSLEYVSSEEIQRRPCNHCPTYMGLTEAVNKIVKAMPVKDIQGHNLKTIRSNELEFMYVIVKNDLQKTGNSNCHKYFDQDPMREYFEGKKEGEYRVLSSELIEMSKVGDIQMIKPGSEAVYYYYRGRGAQKDLLYEIRALENKPYTLTIYRYLATEKEKNPYNLPDLSGESRISDEMGLKLPRQFDQVEQVVTEKEDPNNYLNMEMRLEKRGKYLPKDLHFMQAGTEMNLLDVADLKSETKLSLKERISRWSLKSHETKHEWLQLELKHKGLDEVGTKVSVPYRLTLNEGSGLKVSGHVSEQIDRKGTEVDNDSSHRSLSLVLTDHDLEMVRMEARKSYNGHSSVLLQHGRTLAPNETISVNGGFREDNLGHATFVGFQHAKRIKDTTTLIFDVRIDSQNKTTLMYQVHHKF